jgi:hypothetical protein
VTDEKDQKRMPWLSKSPAANLQTLISPETQFSACSYRTRNPLTDGGLW